MGKIILLGYMGSGKTTVGKILSQKTGMPAFDLDQVIEECTQTSITAIFENKGEIYFRKAEHKALDMQLQKPEDFILSLGGGTPCYANNMELLKRQEVVSIYLKTNVGTLLERLRPEMMKRPLMAAVPVSERADYIAAHLFERSYFYNQADIKVNTDQRTPDQVASEILELLA
ncbi:shikimate kinase [Flavobacterium magnum]|uniref:Shikimate kinase n=1 Tax=Flavobacterium magnum TaxID=2162713 RepID=A0A2S0RDA9_9FLAO|nr:shikimate kinase [Flavobacterium magnum]AWA29927.1 shikimate kinase [Flavobacterium magnum]